MSQAHPSDIVIGIDTHKATHAAVAITALGARLSEITIPTSAAGYRKLDAWAKSLGPVRAIGIEAQDRMELAYRVSCLTRGIPSSKSDVQTVSSVTKKARPIISTPRVPPERC